MKYRLLTPFRSVLLLCLLVVLTVLICGYRWTYTPHGRLDFGAALVANLLTASALTALGNTIIDVHEGPVEEREELLSGGDLPNLLVQYDIGVSAQWGEIPVRIYKPQGEGPFPAMLWVHGGGWITGHRYVTDGPVIELASQLNLLVVSVDYRLLPEHPFPAALDDCYRVLEWMVEQAGFLNIDTDRLVIRGESAGGNLAAATVLKARDLNGPKILFQVLHQPVVDLRKNSQSRWESYRKFGEGYFLDTSGHEKRRSKYVSNEKRLSTYVSPILANLAGLPSAFVSVAEFDPLRDEGEAYSKALQRAGVDTTFYEASGALHSLIGSPTQQRVLFELERRELSRVLSLEAF